MKRVHPLTLANPEKARGALSPRVVLAGTGKEKAGGLRVREVGQMLLASQASGPTINEPGLLSLKAKEVPSASN